MTTEGLVLLVRDGDVARVEMTRPPHNLLDGPMLAELDEAFTEAVVSGCRAIVLSSRQRHFCAGADLDREGDLAGLDLIGFLHRLEELPIPTVAMVHGAALGGGFELALGCDLIIATESAQLGLVETSLGLFPLMGGVQRLVARAGLARAKELALLGRRHTAVTLERWGVINQVVPDDAFQDAGLSLARQLAAGPTIAYNAVRRLANTAAYDGITSADALTPQVAPVVWESDDCRNGIDVFLRTGTAKAVFNGS